MNSLTFEEFRVVHKIELEILRNNWNFLFKLMKSKDKL